MSTVWEILLFVHSMLFTCVFVRVMSVLCVRYGNVLYVCGWQVSECQVTGEWGE